jgi:hypothetical protein
MGVTINPYRILQNPKERHRFEDLGAYRNITRKNESNASFLATDPEDPGSIPGATRFSEK